MDQTLPLLQLNKMSKCSPIFTNAIFSSNHARHLDEMFPQRRGTPDCLRPTSVTSWQDNCSIFGYLKQ